MDDDASSTWIAGAACVMAAALASAACGAAAGTACPAIGWSNTLTVGLADAWPVVDGGSLRVACASPCGVHGPAGPAHELTTPLSGTSTVVGMDMTAPDSITLTVLGPDGTELAVLDADLDWRRVGGSEECGGPHAASVVIPGP